MVSGGVGANGSVSTASRAQCASPGQRSVERSRTPASPSRPDGDCEQREDVHDRRIGFPAWLSAASASSSPAAPASSRPPSTRRLVDANEIIALDNLHRDTLSGSELAGHPNLTFVQGDVLDAERSRELARGATHIVHCAAIAGVDTVIKSPVLTMRVNMIGTYNVLEAALATQDTVERLDRVLDQRGLRHARLQRRGGRSVTTMGSVGEARWTYAVSKLAGEHMAHAYHDELGLPDRHGPAVQRLRPGPGRRRRDPQVHRGGARRA